MGHIYLIIGVLGVFIVVAFILIIQIAKQIPQIYNFILTGQALRIGQRLPDLGNIKYDDQSTLIMLFIGNVDCSTCQKVLERILKKQLHKQITIQFLFHNNKERIKDYISENNISVFIHSIDSDDIKKLSIPAEPFIYIIDKSHIIQQASTIYSIKKLDNLISTQVGHINAYST